MAHFLFDDLFRLPPDMFDSLMLSNPFPVYHPDEMLAIDPPSFQTNPPLAQGQGQEFSYLSTIPRSSLPPGTPIFSYDEDLHRYYLDPGVGPAEIGSFREKDAPANAQDALRNRLSVNLQAIGDSSGQAAQQETVEDQQTGARIKSNEPLMDFSRPPRTPQHGPSRSQRKLMTSKPSPYASVSPLSTPSLSPYSLSVASTPSASPAVSTPAALPSDDDDSNDNDYVPAPPHSGCRKKRSPQQRRSSPQKNRIVRGTPKPQSAKNDGKMTNLQMVLKDLPYKLCDIKRIDGLWQCPFPDCSHKTASEGDLGRHLESRAHATHTYVCLSCFNTYSRLDAMKRHHNTSTKAGNACKATHDRRVKRDIAFRIPLEEFKLAKVRNEATLKDVL